MPAYLSGLCRRLGKNKRIQRWLDRQVCRTPAHVELAVPLMTTWRYLTGPLEVDKSITSCKKMPDPLFCPLQDRGEKPGHVIRVVPEVKEEQESAAVAAPASAEHRPMWSSRCLYWTTGVPLGAPRVILLFGLRMCQLSSQSGTGPCGAHGTSGGLVKSHVEIPQN